MPEYVLDGETGYVFDDLPMLTDRLRRLASDPALVERLGREARATGRDPSTTTGSPVPGWSRSIEPLIARAREMAA